MAFASFLYQALVNVKLNTNAMKKFLSKTKFYESGFSERVSGSGEMRMEMLKKITEKSASVIIEEYNNRINSVNSIGELAFVLAPFYYDLIRNHTDSVEKYNRL